MGDTMPACENWYTFPSSLTWSNDCEVQKLLSDIPIIAIAILAFGVSVLFFVIKRVTLATIWLYLSVFLAFMAAILDLSQTLAIDTENAAISANIRPFITAREILLALSTGLRFLFYWSYVAEPSSKALHATTTVQDRRSNFLILESTAEIDVGGWTLWGMAGKLLMVALLVSVVAITTLQIVWRVVSEFHHYSNVYATDTALELVVSVLLFLKLFLTSMAATFPDNARRRSLGECLAPMCALLVNVALTVGNLLLFAFTESTIGRSLQAVEFYIIIIFVAVLAFDKYRGSLTATCASVRTVASPVNPEPRRRSISRVSPPTVSTPRILTIFGPSAGAAGRWGSKEAFRHSIRASPVGASSWGSSRLSRSLPAGEDESKLWSHSGAEGWGLDPRCIPNRRWRESLGSLKEWKTLAHDAIPSPLSILSAVGAQSDSTPSRDISMDSGRIFQALSTKILPRSAPARIRTSLLPGPALALTSSYHEASNEIGVIMTTPPDVHAQDSPVYGLGGMVRRPLSLGTSAHGPGVSLDDLLKQRELEKSISALLSSRKSPIGEIKNLESSRLSSSTGATRRTTSDVSLSKFPTPPRLTSPVAPPSPPHPLAFIRRREDRRARLADFTSTAAADRLPPPPKITAFFPDTPSSPHSDYLSDSGRPPRFNSGGTQYDVTSFIGDLTMPGEHRKLMLLSEKPLQSADCGVNLGPVVDDESSVEPTSVRSPAALAARTLQHPTAWVPSSPPTFSHSPLGNEISVDGNVEIPQHPLSAQTPVACASPVGQDVSRMDRGVVELPPRLRAKQQMTSTKALPLDGRADEAARLFERRRPPPLVLK